MVTILDILHRDHIINFEDASNILGHGNAVYRMVQKGELKKVYPEGLGLFSLPNTEEGLAQFAAVKKYYPQCIVSGPTALSLYGMSLDYIGKIDVDIPREKNISNELLNVHRVVESKICLVQERSFEESGVPFPIKIYSPERCLFEAYKYYKGLDSYFYALKMYHQKYLNKKSPGKQYEDILRFNKKKGREIIDLLMMENK